MDLPHASIQPNQLPAMAAFFGVGDYESAKKKPVRYHCGLSHALELFGYEYSPGFHSVSGNTYASIESGKNRMGDGYARRTCGYFGVAVPPPPQFTLMKAARSVRKGVSTLKKHKMETGSKKKAPSPSSGGEFQAALDAAMAASLADSGHQQDSKPAAFAGP
jgi:hypothetical protein